MVLRGTVAEEHSLEIHHKALPLPGEVKVTSSVVSCSINSERDPLNAQSYPHNCYIKYSGTVLNATVLNAIHPLHGPAKERLYILSALILYLVCNMHKPGPDP